MDLVCIKSNLPSAAARNYQGYTAYMTKCRVYKILPEEHYTFFLTDGKVYEAELYDVYYEKVEYVIRCDDGVVRPLQDNNKAELIFNN